ncbi:unnamed protein product [Urochloa humidicola]
MAPPPRAPPGAPPELIDDAMAEILLRVPPDEPADLIRASVVCKPWFRVASDPAFLRRYRAFHRGAPLLGFFYSVGHPCYSPPFIPTTAAPPLRKPAYDDQYWRVRDCRHCRVVLMKSFRKFVVWDPLTGHQEELPMLDITYADNTVVVLCAVAGCDHRDCHGGPFLVVCMGHDNTDRAVCAYVCSSEARAWFTPDSSYLHGSYMFDSTRAAVIGNEIYCVVDHGGRILKYDLVKHCFSVINLPAVYKKRPHVMQNEDGSLGLAGVSDSRLYLWSRMLDPEGVAGWVQQRVIKLKILPKARVFGFAEGAGVFMISTKAGAFMIELKSERVKKVGERMGYCTFFPFISFFTPDYARGKLPSLAETN